MSNIVIGAASISGFNSKDVGADVALTGLGVQLGLATVTGAFRSQWVGMGGFRITFSTGITYTVASVESTSSLTLTTNYAESSGTVTGTWRKYAVLRVYVLNPFTPSGETFVAQSGSPGSPNWFRRYAVAVQSDGTQFVAYLPQIILPATTNSSVPTARYFAAIYGQSGAFIQGFPGCEDTFRLDSTTTPTSWPQICTFDLPGAPAPPVPLDYYTRSQIDARFPSGTANQLLYFKNTGNVLNPLTLSGDFAIASDTLSLSAPVVAYNRIQEEGSNLPQRNTLNFIGTSFTATDEVGVRTNVTADADLDAIASNSTNGIYARTGAGTVAARTITGPAAGITVTNGNGVSGNPTLALADDLNAVEGLATNGMVARTATSAWTTRTITGTANRIGVTNGDGVAGNPTLDIGTDVVTLTGSQTLTNKTLTSPRVGTAILDTNGNEIIRTPATGSAVNDVTVTNAATGNAPSVAASGDDANIGLTLASKGTGDVVIQSNTNTNRVTVHGTNAEAYLGNGITNASPATSFTILATGGSGTNIAGAHMELSGGKGTGNAAPGQIAARYPRKTSSGTTLQSLSTERFPFSSSMYSNTAGASTISNTTTETSVFGGATASPGSTLTIESGVAAVGTVYMLYSDHAYATTGTPTIRIKVKLGSAIIVDTTAFNATTGTGNGRAWIITNIFVQAVGAAGSVRTEMIGYMLPGTQGALTPLFFTGSTGSIAVDFTANQTLDVTIQWGTASASNAWAMLNTSVGRDR